MFDELPSFHGYGNSGGVINRACSQVPGVQVPGDDYHLLGMFGTLEVGHDVVAQHVRPGLRSQRDVQAHLALSGEMSNEVSVLAGYRARRNTRRRAPSGMRQAVIGAADGTHQRSDRSHMRSPGQTMGRFLPAEREVEKNSFPRHSLPPKSFHLIKPVHHDYFG